VISVGLCAGWRGRDRSWFSSSHSTTVDHSSLWYVLASSFTQHLVDLVEVVEFVDSVNGRKVLVLLKLHFFVVHLLKLKQIYKSPEKWLKYFYLVISIKA